MNALIDVGVDDWRVYPNELRVRYVYMNDYASDVRYIWMSDCFSFFQSFMHSENDGKFLSTVSSDFDVLVVGGNDARRITQLVRANRALLNRKLKIALMEGSNSTRRARVITAGFDDAIDVGRVAPVEGAARIRAMWRRYEALVVRERSQCEASARLAFVSYPESLSKTELKALQFLVEKPEIVTYSALMNGITDYHEPISFAHLKTVISMLRRKLRPGVEIVSEPTVGYRLRLP